MIQGPPFSNHGHHVSAHYDWLDVVCSEGEVACQLELQAVRRTLQSGSCALIVDDEEVAVGPVDVTHSHIDERQAGSGVELN